MYHKYGHFYDETQGNPDGKLYLKLIKENHPKAKTLLEIACGTGSHLLPISKYFDVEGLDISKTMLNYAKKKLPHIRFYNKDMSNFNLSKKYDLIICPYDSINHLLDFKKWQSLFKCASQHLNPKGVFIFDINTEFRLAESAISPPWIHSFKNNYLIMDVKENKNNIYDWNIKVFEHVGNNRFQLHEETIREKSFPRDKIKQGLLAHFKKVKIIDLKGWSTRPRLKARRLFYIAVKN